MDNILLNESSTNNSNTVKDLVLARLLNDGIITEKEFDNYTEKWQIIIVKNNWFKTWMDKFNRKKDGYSFRYVKFED